MTRDLPGKRNTCLFAKHLAKVTMSKTNFTVISYRTRDTECLQDRSPIASAASGCFCILFDCDSSTYCVSPVCVFETDWLNFFTTFYNIKTSSFCNFLASSIALIPYLVQAANESASTTVFFHMTSNNAIILSSLLLFVRGSIILTASVNTAVLSCCFFKAC